MTPAGTTDLPRVLDTGLGEAPARRHPAGSDRRIAGSARGAPRASEDGGIEFCSGWAVCGLTRAAAGAERDRPGSGDPEEVVRGVARGFVLAVTPGGRRAALVARRSADCGVPEKLRSPRHLEVSNES